MYKNFQFNSVEVQLEIGGNHTYSVVCFPETRCILCEFRFANNMYFNRICEDKICTQMHLPKN